MVKPGDRINDWTVICTNEEIKAKKRKILCRCVCGQERTLCWHALKTGRTRACMKCSGRKRRTTRKLSNGEQFGDWVVRDAEHKLPNTKYGSGALVEHSCGFLQVARRHDLVNGKPPNCKGCKHRSQIEIGSRLGGWTVTGYASQIAGRRSMLVVKCECGRSFCRIAATVISNLSKQCLSCHNSKKEVKKYQTDCEKMNGYWNRLQKHAVKREIEVTTSLEFITELLAKQDFRCAISGLPIQIVPGKRKPGEPKTTASLDRIDSDGDYADDNVQWVHYDINMMKGVLKNDRFIELCRGVAFTHLE